MSPYLHHIIFDPLSAWEQLKLECYILVPLFSLIAFVAYLRLRK